MRWLKFRESGRTYMLWNLFCLVYLKQRQKNILKLSINTTGTDTVHKQMMSSLLLKAKTTRALKSSVLCIWRSGEGRGFQEDESWGSNPASLRHPLRHILHLLRPWPLRHAWFVFGHSALLEVCCLTFRPANQNYNRHFLFDTINNNNCIKIIAALKHITGKKKGL